MKKILLYTALILGLPILVAAGFMGFAMTVDEFTYTTRVEVDRPVDEVWAALHDTQRLPDWLDSLQTIQLASGEALQPGAVWELHFDIDGQAFDMTETVTACTPPNLYGFDVDNDYFTGHTEIRLEEAHGGTVIATTNSVAAKKALFRAVFYIQRGMIAEHAENSYLELKKLLEPQGPTT